MLGSAYLPGTRILCCMHLNVQESRCEFGVFSGNLSLSSMWDDGFSEQQVEIGTSQSFLLPSSPLSAFIACLVAALYLLSVTSHHCAIPDVISSSLWSPQHFVAGPRCSSSSDTYSSATAGKGANAAIQPAHVGTTESSAAAGESPAPQNPEERREDAHGHVQEEPSHPLQWECI